MSTILEDEHAAVISVDTNEQLFDYLADSHCHPQDDMENVSHLNSMRVSHVAVMAERRSDWQNVERIYELYSGKAIPCFGIHPWFSHLHALEGENTENAPLLESKSNDDVQAASVALKDRGDIPIPASEWKPELRRLLLKHPYACVGEFGLDKAAVLLDVGVRGVQPNFEHQTALVRHHLQLAAELNRPVSMHCVRCYGFLEQLFRQMTPEECPSKIMLHSFGGSPDIIKGFTKIPKVGTRFYFSFSSVINSKNMDKLVQRIQQVPDDRLLMESDQTSATKIAAGLVDICQVTALAKGWSLEETAQRTYANFREFYAQSLLHMDDEGTTA
eukprot:CAMPEP_0198198322 /NCGR_PEP_ID=MMETSP1445-20131203/1807_1 /TAXON_ID=36898 /ORGANISM="Pyramimonas sp., Strain CCMP2087" /LENGTH=329 /DNA_ID=CAMNT_0043867851 /DNA_START=457 /DNA_END=1446 /DNA_ORIENTATION=-